MPKQDKKNRKGAVKGAQIHEEGEHGAKTREAILEQLNANGRHTESGSQREQSDPNRHGKHSGEAADRHEREINDPQHDGGHRLFEERKQHDIADRNSDKNRLIKDVGKHGHDREQFQIPGGRDVHPKLGKDGPDETMRSPAAGGK